VDSFFTKSPPSSAKTSPGSQAPTSSSQVLQSTRVVSPVYLSASASTASSATPTTSTRAPNAPSITSPSSSPISPMPTIPSPISSPISPAQQHFPSPVSSPVQYSVHSPSTTPYSSRLSNSPDRSRSKVGSPSRNRKAFSKERAKEEAKAILKKSSIAGSSVNQSQKGSTTPTDTTPDTSGEIVEMSSPGRKATDSDEEVDNKDYVNPFGGSPLNTKSRQNSDKSLSSLNPKKPRRSSSGPQLKKVLKASDSILIGDRSDSKEIEKKGSRLSNRPLGSKQVSTSSTSTLVRKGSFLGALVSPSMTMQQIIHELIQGDFREPIYRLAFILQYKKMASSSDVLDLILEFLHKDDKESPQSKKLYGMTTVFLNTWLEYQSSDLTGDQKFLTFLDEFGEIQSRSAAILRSKFMSVKEASADFPLPELPPINLQWDSFEEEEVALAITFYEFDLFGKISSEQLLAWTTKSKATACSSIHDAISFSNKISHWITSELVRRPRRSDRVYLFEKFVNLGEQLLLLKNFSSCMSLIGGLSSSSFYRMKKTWESANPIASATFEKLKGIMSHSASYASYRAYLKGTTPPSIPFLGVSLSDLTFIDDGNKENEDGSINFQKWILKARVIDNFQSCRSPRYDQIYSFPNGNFLNALESYNFLTEEECHSYSTLVEPKDPEKAMEQMFEIHQKDLARIAELEAQLLALKKDLDVEENGE